MKKVDYRYSGKESRPFWKRIANLHKTHGAQVHDELYTLGVMLQNLETYVLQKLSNEEERNNE